MLFTDRNGTAVAKPEEKEVFDRLSAYGIALSGNKVLLVKSAWSKKLGFPGGGVDADDIFGGLRREFLEETGFSINIISKDPFLASTDLFYADDIDVFFNSKLLFFLVEVTEKLSFADKKEIADCSWHELSKLDAGNINKSHLKAITAVIKIRRGGD